MLAAPDNPHIASAQVVVPCADITPTLAFFTDTLGFRVEMISPADHPTVVVIAGHGICLRLDATFAGDPGELRLLCTDPDAVADGARTLTAPNGTRIDLVDADPALQLPPVHQSFTVSRAGDAAEWGVGRAGMRYRDLIPDREGGRFIASHIHIPAAGPVPDYVHFHKVRFQMIFCYRGWARLVYEDQGPPFVLNAGDCVLQPPEIRHRVLESSADLQVIEIGCPAIHETFADSATILPTPFVLPDRDFDGQRFVRHIAAEADWAPWRADGFRCRTIGFGPATNGLAEAQVVHPVDGSPSHTTVSHDAEFVFMMVLDGAVTLDRPDEPPVRLAGGDSVTLPAGMAHRLLDCTPDLEFLDVTLPANITLAHMTLSHT